MAWMRRISADVLLFRYGDMGSCDAAFASCGGPGHSPLAVGSRVWPAGFGERICGPRGPIPCGRVPLKFKIFFVHEQLLSKPDSARLRLVPACAALDHEQASAALIVLHVTGQSAAIGISLHCTGPVFLACAEPAPFPQLLSQRLSE